MSLTLTADRLTIVLDTTPTTMELSSRSRRGQALLTIVESVAQTMGLKAAWTSSVHLVITVPREAQQTLYRALVDAMAAGPPPRCWGCDAQLIAGDNWSAGMGSQQRSPLSRMRETRQSNHRSTKHTNVRVERYRDA